MEGFCYNEMMIGMIVWEREDGPTIMRLQRMNAIQEIPSRVGT